MATWRPTRRWCWRGRPAWRRATSPTALAGAARAARRGIASAEVAGPGFLNLRLDPARWFGVVPAALAAGADFGRSDLGAGRRVNVEFVSANPTGPMHVGHVRGAVFGDALAGLLDFAGWEVTREYYINDGGAQVDVLARSAYERYREACGLEPAIAEGLYPGRLPDPGRRGAEGAVRHEPARPARVGLAGRGARDRHRGDDGDDPRRPGAAPGADGPLLLREVALRHRPDRGGAGVAGGAGACSTRACSSRRRASCPRTGSRGEQTLFRSTAYGDDTDRPVMKSDGGWTYFAPGHRLSFRQDRARLSTS